MVSVASVSQIYYSAVDIQHKTKAAARAHTIFRRGAKFGSDLCASKEPARPKKGTARPTNKNPQSDTDQQPYHRGMLGSTKRGGEFQQHQTYRQSTSRSENSPKTNRWRHPVSGLQQPFFSQMNIKMCRPLSTDLGNLNARRFKKFHPRERHSCSWIQWCRKRFLEPTQLISKHVQASRDMSDVWEYLVISP